MSQSQINEAGIGAAVGISTGSERSDSSVPPAFMGISQTAWMQMGVITILFAALFWPNLRRLWDKTNPIYGEANWGHAICIPFIGLYYLYVNRESLLHGASSKHEGGSWLRVWILGSLSMLLPLVLIWNELRGIFIPTAAILVLGATALLPICKFANQSGKIDLADEHSAGWFGGYVMFLGIAVFQYAIFPGQNDFLKDLGMVITLFGVVLAMTGWAAMKVAWFPIAFLVCGIPWPGLVYSKVAGPLQQLAANVAVWTLQLTGVEASVNGTKISMVGGGGTWRTLNVAEACAGMRSLMTFISVAAAVAFLSHRPLWQKIIVVLFAVPIAISCNVMRVSGQGLLDRYVSHSLSENFAHQFVGLIMLIPAFLLILLVGWILDQIFVEQIDRRFVAIAPKVIKRTTALAPSAVPTRPASRSLAEMRGETPKTEAQKTEAPKTEVVKILSPTKPPATNPLPRPVMNRPAVQRPVPPPPSVRLAPRPPGPRKKPDSEKGTP